MNRLEISNILTNIKKVGEKELIEAEKEVMRQFNFMERIGIKNDDELTTYKWFEDASYKIDTKICGYGSDTKIYEIINRVSKWETDSKRDMYTKSDYVKAIKAIDKQSLNL